METEFKRAATVQETQWACELTPLPGGDPRWVDFRRSAGLTSRNASKGC